VVDAVHREGDERDDRRSDCRGDAEEDGRDERLDGRDERRERRPHAKAVASRRPSALGLVDESFDAAGELFDVTEESLGDLVDAGGSERCGESVPPESSDGGSIVSCMVRG